MVMARKRMPSLSPHKIQVDITSFTRKQPTVKPPLIEAMLVQPVQINIKSSLTGMMKMKISKWERCVIVVLIHESLIMHRSLSPPKAIKMRAISPLSQEGLKGNGTGYKENS
jgi:hypothetical protein